MFQSDAGRTACTRPYGAAAWPLVIERQRLPRQVFRRSIALLSDSLSTLRDASYPNTTQDSLPVAGQALLDGVLTRKVPMKGFKVVNYISYPFPKLSWRNRCNLCEFEWQRIAGGGGDLCRETASIGLAEELQCLDIVRCRSIGSTRFWAAR